jgi:hypothetical protein
MADGDPTDNPNVTPEPPADAGAPGSPEGPTEEELRQYEEQIRSITVQDLVFQSAASILNLSARRIMKDDERDLEQGKIGIDAVRALVDLVPEQAQAQLRQAISELQLLYAKQAGEGGGDAAPPEGEGGTPPGGSPPPAPKPGSSGLWTPGS